MPLPINHWPEHGSVTIHVRHATGGSRGVAHGNPAVGWVVRYGTYITSPVQPSLHAAKAWAEGRLEIAGWNVIGNTWFALPEE